MFTETVLDEIDNDESWVYAMKDKQVNRHQKSVKGVTMVESEKLRFLHSRLRDHENTHQAAKANPMMIPIARRIITTIKALRTAA